MSSVNQGPGPSSSSNSPVSHQVLGREQENRKPPPILDKELADIKKFIEQHKKDVQHSDVALQTIEGLYKLELAAQKLTRPSLQKDVYTMTGLTIHAAENYPTTEQFNVTVKHAVNLIRNIFKETTSDREKLLFINHGLETRGCFEARLEHLMFFDRDRHSALGLMRMEAQEILTTQGKEATLPEFIAHLDRIDFFKLHKISKEEFNNSEAVATLRSSGLIAPDVMSMPMTDRIHNAFSVYPEFGSGLENFKRYLQENLSLTPEQFSKLDQELDKYFKMFPDHRQWI